MSDTPQQKKSGYGRRSMWQWILIYLVIGGIIYGVFYYFFLAKRGGYNSSQPGQYQYTSPTTTTQQMGTPSATQKDVVVLSATGFTPATMTVKAGTTVTWINNSGQEATVNSNPHPVHTDYPPLNLGEFQNGKKLSLTFNKPGSYGYHNHYNPSQHGTIIVQ